MHSSLPSIKNTKSIDRPASKRVGGASVTSVAHPHLQQVEEEEENVQKEEIIGNVSIVKEPLDRALPPSRYKVGAITVTRKGDKDGRKKEPFLIDRDKNVYPSQIVTMNHTFSEYFFQSMAGSSDGKIKINQDTVYVDTGPGGSRECSLFGVFDGHGTLGHKVSDYLRKHLQGR